MSALALIAVLLLARQEGRVCDDCTPRRLCAPHAAEIDDELKELERGLKDEDPEVRRRVLVRAGELNSGHVNAPSKKVTQVIASGLEDESLALRTLAAGLLRSGQDPEVAVRALAGSVREVPRVLARARDTGEEARPAMEFALAVVDAAGGYRDDRSVEALGAILERDPESLYGDVIYRIVDALTGLTARAGIEALIGYYQLMESLQVFGVLEKHIHGRLTELAAARGLEGAPAWSDEGVSREWKRWFDENERSLPKKLGKARLDGED